MLPGTLDNANNPQLIIRPLNKEPIGETKYAIVPPIKTVPKGSNNAEYSTSFGALFLNNSANKLTTNAPEIPP